MLLTVLPCGVVHLWTGMQLENSADQESVHVHQRSVDALRLGFECCIHDDSFGHFIVTFGFGRCAQLEPGRR